MYFAIVARDRPGLAELRSRLRPEHRAWLRKPGNHPVVVRLGGPLLDSQGAMDGTLLVVEAGSVEDVRGFLAEDPYCRNNLFERMEVRHWQWSLGLPDMEVLNSK